MPDILVHNMSLKPKQTTSLLNKVSLDVFKTETSVPYKGVPYKINCVYGFEYSVYLDVGYLGCITRSALAIYTIALTVYLTTSLVVCSAERG